MEGIFSAVYTAWEEQSGRCCVEIRTEEPENLELFCIYRQAESSQEKAVKVARSIRRKLGEEFYEYICFAALAQSEEKGTAIYRTLVQALSGGKADRRVIHNLADPYVNTVFRLRRRVWHETHQYQGFIRFRELPGKILFSEIKPENDVLSLLAPHFADRLPEENWMIYDEGRQTALFHPRLKEVYIRKNLVLPEEVREELSLPETYESLWKEFCTSIAIAERRNPRCQQQFLPLHFRDNMVEFR